MGVGDFSQEIDRAWKGLEKWTRTEPSTGDSFMPPSQSQGWDTPLSMLGILRNAEGRDFTPQESRSLTRAAEWLIRVQPRQDGDWTYMAPELKPGGWSFLDTNPIYPDTDVTGVTLEALALYMNKPELQKIPGIKESFNRGFDWLIGMQNKDGSFPAWDRGASQAMAIMGRAAGFPDFMDIGQVDVSSRIIKELTVILSLGILDPERQKQAEDTIEMAGKYIMENRSTNSPMTWFGDWASNYVYGTGEAMDALLAAQQITVDEATPSIEWLASLQQADGGWGEDSSSYEAKKYVQGPTNVGQSYAPLMALIRYEEAYRAEYGTASPYRAQIDKAVNFIKRKIGIDGEVNERTFSGVMVKGLWFVNYELLPEQYALMTLARYEEFKENEAHAR